MRSRTFCVSVTLLVLVVSALSSPEKNINWPSFRGPNGAGVAEGWPLPDSWNVETSRNVRWKTSIPGLGLSSPVVWGDRIFISTAVGGQQDSKLKPGLYGDIWSVNDSTSHRWIVYCIDKRTGRIIWEKTARSGVPQIKRHPKSTHANSTLATDGKRVVAFFGSEGLYCYDTDGKLLWSKDLGVLDAGYYVAPMAQWEFGSSPVIYEDLVILQCDVLKGSFVAAFNLTDGGELWRTSRDVVPTWSTPAIYASGRDVQVVINGFKHIGGYDVRTGKELWRMHGGGDIPVPTPVIAGDMAFVTSAHGALAPVYAIRLNGKGDISLQGDQTSNDYVAWMNREGSYMATPLVYGDLLYNCRWNGVLCCYDLKSGDRLYQERLGGGESAFTVSPVAGDGKVYVASEDGDYYVVKAGPKCEVLAKIPMGEVCMATPAISEGMLLIRTQGHLIAIASAAH